MFRKSVRVYSASTNLKRIEFHYRSSKRSTLFISQNCWNCVSIRLGQGNHSYIFDRASKGTHCILGSKMQIIQNCINGLFLTVFQCRCSLKPIFQVQLEGCLKLNLCNGSHYNHCSLLSCDFIFSGTYVPRLPSQYTWCIWFGGVGGVTGVK